ncbi:MAG: methyltransferase domain-containing protein [Bacteroidota bacterium]|jgi:SAM-dependent methyltransferase
MFYPDRIKSIKSTDKVLEIGPGATPYFRSDVFLELQYDNEQERIAQSGYVGILQTQKQIVYYDGGRFPFEDKEFDYVICSHVLEHVNDADVFLREIQRVGKQGYLEFPTVYYDYIYNFPEHQLFLLEKDGIVNWMTKEESGLFKFASIQRFFYRSCELGYYETIDNFKDYFFQGFEWFDTIKSMRVSQIELIVYPKDKIDLKQKQNGKGNESEEKMYSMISLKKLLKYKLKKFFK